ncbi:MAG: GNAT family N-acetyltransferase [Candidatus Ratteibacteria bacterium]|jgi:ribosomal protein S18 acetylase RimI-like enzyme
MNKVTIRKASVDDLNAIGNLWQEFMDFHKSRDPRFTRSADGHERFKEFISGHMTLDTSRVLVAEEDGKVVGYCLAKLAKYPPVFEKQDYGTVFDLAVTERCRRSGIGAKLYHVAQVWFAEHEIHRIELRVAVSNETSTAFWKKMGFSPYATTVSKNI